MIKTLAILVIFLLLCAPVHAGFATDGLGVGATSFVISDNAVLDNADSDWTYAFYWRNDTPASVVSYDTTLVANIDSASANPGFVIYCSETSGPDNLSTRNNDDGTADSNTISSLQECATTGWRRYIVEHSGNVVNVYLDGVLVATSTNTVGASSGPAGGLYFGSDPSGTNGMPGAFCDIAKWTQVFSSAEKSALNKYSAAMYKNNLSFFIPAVRAFQELKVPLTVTNGGATVVSCPSLIRPN